MIEILILDDEENQAEMLKKILELETYKVFTSQNINKSLEIIKNNNIDLVLSDYKLKNETGEEFLDKLKSIVPNIEFILITAFGTIETAVRCMKKGAFGFLTKPINMDELKENIKKAIDNKKIREENIKLKELLSENSSYQSIIGESEKIIQVKKIIEKVSDLDVPVLVTGETGTGKELVAKSIHYTSKIKNEPFIAVNMAGIPNNLVESELFGHIKGSFTGAIKDKKGKFELAGNGTIFLDEIGEMNYDLQSKLLRVLQENEIQKVGSEKNQNISCRVIAATNRNLEKEIEKGTFREDLYYRLNIVNINLPSLKERGKDIEVLINYFIEKYYRKYNIDENKKNIYINNIKNKYNNYKFPGNVRELENLVERYLILPDEIENNIENELNIIDSDYKYAGKTIKEIEKEAILETLEYCEGNKNKAARILGISPRGIRNKITEYNEG